MAGVLEQVEPQLVWKYFEEIASIPHGSFNTKQISDYLVGFAKEHGFEHYQDDLNNVIIIKEASAGYEDREPVIIQGHIDMVAEKTPNASIDMEKEGLTLYVDGEYLKAKDTTLGGDDGIAIAMGMAFLTDETLKHPRLELVCTVDEEVGLIGATGIDLAPLKGRTLINLDSEEEGIFTAGCAGGMSYRSRTPMAQEQVNGLPVRFVFDGFKGGHSGQDVKENRANANLTAGRVLYALAGEFSLRVSKMEGGSKDNVISRYTEAEAVLEDPAELKELKAKLAAVESDIKSEYNGIEDALVFSVEACGDAAEQTALTKDAQKALFAILANLPNGIQKMSGEIDGLVDTSLNLGVLKLSDGELYLSQSVRSSKASSKKWLAERLGIFLSGFGADCWVDGDYPGWEFVRESKIRDRFVSAYQELFGEDPVINVIHAGLECGLLTDKLPGLDCISLGPEMHNVHTTEEELSIPSTERCYRLVRKVIEG